jgi:hypothetical protein
MAEGLGDGEIFPAELSPVTKVCRTPRAVLCAV